MRDRLLQVSDAFPTQHTTRLSRVSPPDSDGRMFSPSIILRLFSSSEPLLVCLISTPAVSSLLLSLSLSSSGVLIAIIRVRLALLSFLPASVSRSSNSHFDVLAHFLPNVLPSLTLHSASPLPAVPQTPLYSINRATHSTISASPIRSCYSLLILDASSPS